MKNLRFTLIFGLLLAGCGGSTDPTTPDLTVLDSTPLPDLNGPDAASDSADTGDLPTDPLAACSDQLVPALTWFDAEDATPLPGEIEFGQTHVVKDQDVRRAPTLTAQKEALFLFTPQEEVSDDADGRVVAYLDGVQLGVVRLSPPSQPVPILEQGLTKTQLSPYSTKAWSTTLPWNWVQEGVALKVGLNDGDNFFVREHTLQDLSAPHRFTITRTHLVLFGESTFRLSPPNTTAKISVEFSSSIPGAELRWVNTTPWRLDSIVVNTNDGPRWAHSEDERLAITSDADRWNILKHQAALRLSLANTGRGLRMTLPPQGDNSPYSFGTSMSQGWVRVGDGTYTDINNAGLAAGWTGWSGMWLDECGNGFIHEVGHTLTLEHFDEGTAAGWGIDDEYPLDGTNLETHPWGYDSLNGLLRTWYRVDSEGPVMENGQLVGKRDPMNGGEAPNAITCFPQYTAYQTQKAQAWQQDNPTLLNVDGVAGIYLWSKDQKRYLPQEPVNGNQKPRAVDVPVVTLIGTLGNLDEVCQTYPPVFFAEGNAFLLPDPTDPALSAQFEGAKWFLEISYADESVERALINRGEIESFDTGLYLYSLNLEWSRTPTKVSLFKSPTGYPNVSIDEATLIHTRTIEPPQTALPGVVNLGRGSLANSTMRLKNWCDPGFNCSSRWQESTFLKSEHQISFRASAEAETQGVLCSQTGSFVTWKIPVVSDNGAVTEVTVHSQRVVRGAGKEITVRADDQTPWIHSPETRQSLRIWIPYEDNKDLSPGRYTTPDPFMITALQDGLSLQEVPLEIDLVVHNVENITIPPTYLSEGIKISENDPPSSLYYVFEDAGIGPSASKWWGDDSGDIIYVPVVDQEGEAASLVLRAHKVACGAWWEINTGQSADWGCTHQVQLGLEPGANDELVSGHSYSSPGSHPVVIKGIRWHDPGSGQVLGVLALDISYTAP